MESHVDKVVSGEFRLASFMLLSFVAVATLRFFIVTLLVEVVAHWHPRQ
jgi:hypothetical protein